MNCPLKPSLTCAGTPELADEGRCIGCPAGRASGRPAASGDLPLSPPLAALRRQLRRVLAEGRSTCTVATVGVEQVETRVLAPFNHTVEKSGVEVERVERPSQMPDSTFLINLRSTQRVESADVPLLSTGGEA